VEQPERPATQIAVGVLNPTLYLLLEPRKPISALTGRRDSPTQGIGQLACGLGGQADAPQDFNARRLFLEQPRNTAGERRCWGPAGAAP